MTDRDEGGKYFSKIYEAIVANDMQRFTDLLGLSIEQSTRKLDSSVLLKWLLNGCFRSSPHILREGLHENFYTLAFQFVKDKMDESTGRFEPVSWPGISREYGRIVSDCRLASGIAYHHYALELLLDCFDEFDINQPCDSGTTPLMAVVAAEFSKVEDIEMLLSMGADLQYLSKSNGKALHCLDIFNVDCASHMKMIALLNAGADPEEELEYCTYDSHRYAHSFYDKPTSFLEAVEIMCKQVKKEFNHGPDGSVEMFTGTIKQFINLKKANQLIEHSAAPARKASTQL